MEAKPTIDPSKITVPDTWDGQIGDGLEHLTDSGTAKPGARAYCGYILKGIDLGPYNGEATHDLCAVCVQIADAEERDSR